MLRSRGRLDFSELKNDGLLKRLALKIMDQRKPVYRRRKMDAYVRSFIILFVYIYQCSHREPNDPFETIIT